MLLVFPIGKQGAVSLENCHPWAFLEVLRQFIILPDMPESYSNPMVDRNTGNTMNSEEVMPALP